jgi:hypothetical protein
MSTAGLQFENKIERSWASIKPSELPSPFAPGVTRLLGEAEAFGEVLGETESEGDGLPVAEMVISELK